MFDRSSCEATRARRHDLGSASRLPAHAPSLSRLSAHAPSLSRLPAHAPSLSRLPTAGQFGQDGMGSIPATPSTKYASCIEISIKLIVCSNHDLAYGVPCAAVSALVRIVEACAVRRDVLSGPDLAGERCRDRRPRDPADLTPCGVTCRAVPTALRCPAVPASRRSGPGACRPGPPAAPQQA